MFKQLFLEAESDRYDFRQHRAEDSQSEVAVHYLLSFALAEGFVFVIVLASLNCHVYNVAHLVEVYIVLDEARAGLILEIDLVCVILVVGDDYIALEQSSVDSEFQSSHAVVRSGNESVERTPGE